MMRIPRLILTESPSAAGTIRQSTRNSEIVAKVVAPGDPLTSGPLVGLDLPDAFCGVRQSFWEGVYSRQAALSMIPPGAVLAEFDTLVHLLDRSDRIELWLGGSAAEQVFAAFLAGLADAGVWEPAQAWLLQFDTPRRLPSLGFRRKEYFEARPPETPFHTVMSAYRAAWSALSSPDPSALSGMLASGTGLPLLDHALATLLLRYPDADTGLGSVDKALLDHSVPDWTGAARVVGSAMALGLPDGDLVGDVILFDRVKVLSSGPSPCMELRGDPSTMRSAEVRLTPFGAECLAGRASRLANGIDEWIGGVHLDSSARRVWVRHGIDIVPA